jgi:hypothetical protein
MRRTKWLFLVSTVLFGAEFVATPAWAVFTAYINPAGSFSPYTGAPFGTVPWGMDFDVNAAPVSVTALGAYDYLQDGNFLHDVVVGVYNRDTQTLVGTTLTFSSTSPGTLEGGSRFSSSPARCNWRLAFTVQSWHGDSPKLAAAGSRLLMKAIIPQRGRWIPAADCCHLSALRGF